MFDFLTKLSHQHPKKVQPQSQTIEQSSYPNDSKNQFVEQNLLPSRVQQPPQTKAPKKKILSLSAQLQAGDCAELPQQTLSLLQKIKDESEARFNGIVLNMIEQQKAGVQRKVYLREMSNNNQQYLEQILIQSSSQNRFVRHGLAQIIDSVADSITSDILDTNKYHIQKRIAMGKDQLTLLSNSLHHIKSKEGNIRNKVGELKMQLMNEAQRIEERSYDIVNKESYNPNHQKTKQVQYFLKNIQMQREQDRMRYQQKLRQEKQRKRRKQQRQEMMKEKALSERHERLAEVIDMKRRIKEEEKAMAKKREENFQQFLKTYKKQKPLFKQIQEKFQQDYIKKREEQIFYKLMQRKQAFEPMNLEEIDDHEQRYQEEKQEYKKRKRRELKLTKEAQKNRLKSIEQLYKGKSRYYVLQEMVEKKERQKKDPNEEIKKNKLKQQAYSMDIKEYHKPTVDPAKRMQIQSLLIPKKQNRYNRNPIRMRVNSSYDGGELYYLEQEKNNNIIQEKDAKKDGQKNMRFLKRYLGQKIKAGQVKKPENTHQQRASTISHKTNYLNEVRQNRQNREKTASKYETIDQEISSIKRRQDVGALKAKVEQYDAKAQRLEKKLKLAAHKPEDQTQLQNDYLFSIKAKMELLNNFD